MRNIFFILCLLLVQDVSGDEKSTGTVSVMEGDSVTLNPDDAEIQRDDELLWTFNGYIITSDAVAERFRGRMKQNQIGSLTIKNIQTTDSGLYQLKIGKSTEELFKRYNVTVHDVFIVDTDGVKSVSVTEGDTVTLHTGFIKKQTDERIHWKFGAQDLNGWSDQTGDLTISNIRREQSGVYELEINTSRMILHRTLRINITDEMKDVSVKEGESVSLRTGLFEIQGYDLILWKYGEDVIGNINKKTNQFSVYDRKDKRFKGRLQLHHKSGSLLIGDSQTTDSGVYHLQMNSSSHTVQRNISVTVKTITENTDWKAIAIVLTVVLILILIGIIVGIKKGYISRSSRRSVLEINRKDDHLNLACQQ